MWGADYSVCWREISKSKSVVHFPVVHFGRRPPSLAGKPERIYPPPPSGMDAGYSDPPATETVSERSCLPVWNKENLQVGRVFVSGLDSTHRRPPPVGSGRTGIGVHVICVDDVPCRIHIPNLRRYDWALQAYINSLQSPSKVCGSLGMIGQGSEAPLGELSHPGHGGRLDPARVPVRVSKSRRSLELFLAREATRRMTSHDTMA